MEVTFKPSNFLLVNTMNPESMNLTNPALASRTEVVK